MRKIILSFLWSVSILYVFSQSTQNPLPDSTQSSLPFDRNIDLEEVKVNTRFKDVNLLSGSTGISIDIKEIKLLPNIIGDADPFEALQYLGGVSQSGEGNSGLYVRGGNNDQNLILLNGALIQNPTHVLGMFSVFNPDIIEKMRFIKSGLPAEYGGRLSSVVDVGTTNNPIEKPAIDGSVGLISSRLAVQMPLGKRLSAYGAFRGSYLNTLILPALNLLGVDSTLTRNRYEYLDANAGIICSLGKKSKISAHIYYGKDNILIKEVPKWDFSDNSIFWSNKAASLQFTHIFDPNWSMNHLLSFSGFNLGSNLKWGNSSYDIQSLFKSFSYKAEFFRIKDQHQIKFGFQADLNQANPHLAKSDSLNPIEFNNEYNLFRSEQLAVFFRDEWTSDRLQVNAGIRVNGYLHLGPFTDYFPLEAVQFARNKIVKSYFNIEPRLFSRFLIDDESSLKAAITRHTQYFNQIPMMAVGVPLDLQIPASLHIKPQGSWHFSTGYFRNLSSNQYETSIETYYKTLENQLEFISGLMGTFSNKMLEKNILTGQGWSYGVELKFRKTKGDLTGWLSYNLAWSYRQFDELNRGLPYLATNDRRHDLSVVGVYRLNQQWSFTALFVYASGSRLNLPLSWFIIDKKVVLEYGKYNAFTMPPYHRMDVSATCKLKPIKHIESELSFSVYNLYNRANPFQIYYNTENFYSGSNRYDFNIGMSYLLPIVPSVSWTFHFR